MWYNVIPFFVPLDPSLYPTYPTGTKGLDFSIFRNCIGYVLGNVYPIPRQPIVPPTYTPYSVGNQFLTMVQPIASKDRQHVQQRIIAPILTIIYVTTSLPTYVRKGSTHQPLDGRQFKYSLGGSSPGGDSPRESPFIPLVGSYPW
jgi:hypothetical protein